MQCMLIPIKRAQSLNAHWVDFKFFGWRVETKSYNFFIWCLILTKFVELETKSSIVFMVEIAYPSKMVQTYGIQLNVGNFCFWVFKHWASSPIASQFIELHMSSHEFLHVIVVLGWIPILCIRMEVFWLESI